ncbi:protein of unknown function [Cupriavidus taiwanensis]|uniref:Uncharacterized protein n=1 Tax=Cupriavidus taiwanensis TaxID=164546 RepID=A0A375IH83_9BURK|nr:hypothetical protein CBM2629_A80093 [Cupriavidus taiwanensis]SPK72899.1 protein of unknown function [Cupriavidus taiwanensis]
MAERRAEAALARQRPRHRGHEVELGLAQLRHMVHRGLDRRALAVAERRARLLHLQLAGVVPAEVKHLGGGHGEGLGQPADVGQREVALAAFDAAQVGAREPAFERKRLLGPASLLAQPGKMQSEKSEISRGHGVNKSSEWSEAKGLTLRPRQLILILTIGVRSAN